MKTSYLLTPITLILPLLLCGCFSSSEGSADPEAYVIISPDRTELLAGDSVELTTETFAPEGTEVQFYMWQLTRGIADGFDLSSPSAQSPVAHFYAEGEYEVRLAFVWKNQAGKRVIDLYFVTFRIEGRIGDPISING